MHIHYTVVAVVEQENPRTLARLEFYNKRNPTRESLQTILFLSSVFL